MVLHVFNVWWCYMLSLWCVMLLHVFNALARVRARGRTWRLAQPRARTCKSVTKYAALQNETCYKTTVNHVQSVTKLQQITCKVLQNYSESSKVLQNYSESRPSPRTTARSCREPWSRSTNGTICRGAESSPLWCTWYTRVNIFVYTRKHCEHESFM